MIKRALASALLPLSLSAQQSNTTWHGTYVSVQQEATASETPFPPNSGDLPLVYSGSSTSRTQKDIAIVVARGGAVGTMTSVNHSLGMSVARARAGCKVPGPIQTFWARGVEETWTKSQAAGKVAVDVDV